MHSSHCLPPHMVSQDSKIVQVSLTCITTQLYLNSYAFYWLLVYIILWFFFPHPLLFFFKSLIMHCLFISEDNAVLSERRLDRYHTPQGVELKNVNYLDVVTEPLLWIYPKSVPSNYSISHFILSAIHATISTLTNFFPLNFSILLVIGWTNKTPSEM